MSNSRLLDNNQKIVLIINKIKIQDIQSLNEWLQTEGDKVLSNDDRATRLPQDKKYDKLIGNCALDIKELIEALAQYKMPPRLDGSPLKGAWGAEDLLTSIDDSFKQMLTIGDLAASSLPSLFEKIITLADMLNNPYYGDSISQVAARMRAFVGAIGAVLNDQVQLKLKSELDVLLVQCQDYFEHLDISIGKIDKEKEPENYQIAVQKRAKVQEFIGILQDDKKPVEVRLLEFKKEFEKKETLDLLAKSRDPKALQFIKQVADTLTFGLFAKWLRVRGAQLASNVNTLFAQSKVLAPVLDKEDLKKSPSSSSSPK